MTRTRSITADKTAMDAAPSDEKGLFLTVKSEVIDTDMKSDISNFGVMLESPVQAFVNPSLPPAPLVPSGLQRYHSAPSSFLHSLNDDAFLQVSSPLDSSSNSRTSNSFIAPFFPDGLTAIIEQMENEKLGTSSTNLNEEFDPYMDAARHDYAKRPALSAAMLQTGKPDTNWQVPTEAFIPDTFQSFFPAPKNNSPAQLSAAAMQEVNERSPTGMAIQSMMSSEESISGTSEDTNYGHGSKTPMYSRDDSFLLSDTSVNLPTSPGSMSGKRHRGVPGGGANTSGQIAEGSIRSRPGVAGSLTRHMSLPVGRTQMRPVDDTSFLETVSGTRAKRGCATHPRSIAERVRRTRISERMKKLQGVVPNMDKQTNTSEMLDEAVEYIRSLQKKVQELTNIVVELRGQEYSRDDS